MYWCARRTELVVLLLKGIYANNVLIVHSRSTIDGGMQKLCNTMHHY